MREVDQILCSCGGEVESDEVTTDEEQSHGCGRGCCTSALLCKKCGVRFFIKYAAPDMDLF